jgi:hypothetical protein
MISGAMGAILLAAPPAHAQSTVSSFTPTVSGRVISSANTPAKTRVVTDPLASENIFCTGPVKITTAAVTDEILPPGVVVSVDARGLSCVGETSGATYVNTGQANLTRSLVATDVIETTFALYQGVPGESHRARTKRAGFLGARTGLLTLHLTYDTISGALSNATGSVGSLP